MAQAGKVSVGNEPTRHKTKLSRDRKEAPVKSEESKAPKLGHRTRKTLTPESKEMLKRAFDDLCCPQADGESRLADWLEVNARKDKDIKSWVDIYAINFPDLKGFNASHFLQGLHAQNFKHEEAIRRTTSLLVRQSAFRSVDSYVAAQTVMKRIRKGDVHKPEILLASVSALANRVKPENLQEAISDVGLKSPVIKGVLNVAINVMDAELDPESFAHEVDGLKLLLKRLENQTKSDNTIRYSATSGTISLDDLTKQAKTLSIASGLERQGSAEKSPSESPLTTPRKDFHRENKSAGKGKSKSRNDLDSELSPEGTRKKEVRDESPGKRRRDDSPSKRRVDESKTQPGTTTNRTGASPFTGSATSSTRGRPEPVPRAEQQSTSPGSGKQGDGSGAESAGSVSSPVKSGHRRQASGQPPAVTAELKQKFGD